MSDDAWRRRPDDSDEGDEDFGEVRFADDDQPTDVVPETGSRSERALSFGPNDTGPLPHWTDPPTGQVPRVLSGSEDDTSDDVDVWSSFTSPSPVWRDERRPGDDTGGFEDLSSGGARPGALDERPAPEDPFFDLDEEQPVAAPPRREPARISIGTDPTDETRGGTGSRSRPIRTDPTRRGTVPPRGRPTSRPPTGPPPATGRDLPVAIAAGVIIAVVFIGALLWTPVAVLALIVLIVGLASIEFFDKVTERGYRPATIAGIAGCIAAPLVAYWVGDEGLPLVVAFALMAAAIGFIGAPGVQSGPMPNTAISMLGVLWVGLLGAYGALILAVSNWGSAYENVGTDTLFLVAVGVVANDVGAFFVGSGIGKTPLREWISPHKSVEGLIGGTVLTFLAVVLVALQSDTWNDPLEYLSLALVIAVMAPLGDLTESMFKRNLDIKDFGTLIRGHGGVLDRFDAFLFVLPASYYLLLVLQPWTS